MKLLPYLLVPICITAISCREEWNDQYKAEYMESCLMEGRFSDSALNHQFCECSMKAVMKHYFTIDEIIANADSTELQEDITVCITETISK